MRIAILADIHANLPALEAVTKDLDRVRPDMVVVAGDFQNRGPQPREVTELVASKEWKLLRGNHEDYVIRQSQPPETLDVADYYTWLPARWTAEQTRQSVQWIRSLPIAIRLEAPDGAELMIAHGSPRSNAEGFFPSTSEEKAIEMIGKDPPRVLCCGHTHFPLLRKMNATLVFNVGSVGFPFDGDQRAAYGLLTWREGNWSTELRRLNYPLAAVLAHFEKDGFCEGAGPLAHIIRREITSAQPHLTPFCRMFGPRLRSRQISIFEAVSVYLALSQEEIERYYRSLRQSCATADGRSRPLS
jgi:predicted phosphodiesterase